MNPFHASQPTRAEACVLRRGDPGGEGGGQADPALSRQLGDGGGEVLVLVGERRSAAAV